MWTPALRTFWSLAVEGRGAPLLLTFHFNNIPRVLIKPSVRAPFEILAITKMNNCIININLHHGNEAQKHPAAK